MKDTRYFSASEFICPDCKSESMSQDFIADLEQARRIANISFKITSGYRCQAYQDDLKRRGYQTAKAGTSPHQLGVAADISTIGDDKRHTIIKSLLTTFNRIGIGSNFIHVDAADRYVAAEFMRNSNRIWHYRR